MEFTDLEKHVGLREQFINETGSHPFADQKYIKWLEERLVKRSDSLTGISAPNWFERLPIFWRYVWYMMGGIFIGLLLSTI